jgi:hypothetical protein
MWGRTRVAQEDSEEQRRDGRAVAERRANSPTTGTRARALPPKAFGTSCPVPALVVSGRWISV